MAAIVTDEASAARRRKALADAIDAALAADGDFAGGIAAALSVVVAAHLDTAGLLDLTCSAVRRLGERVAALEKQAAGQQKKLDHFDAHALVFAGPWTAERGFCAGAIARHADRAFVCLKDTAPGGQPPNRHGSPWALVA